MSFSINPEISVICKALGHPARLDIISILAQQGHCISGDLADRIDLAPSTISEHLRILKKAGLVKGSIEGPKRSYCINKESFSSLVDQFSSLAAQIEKSAQTCEV